MAKLCAESPQLGWVDVTVECIWTADLPHPLAWLAGEGNVVIRRVNTGHTSLVSWESIGLHTVGTSLLARGKWELIRICLYIGRLRVQRDMALNGA